MKYFRIQSIEKLNDIMSNYKSGYFFRGQCQHYTHDNDGSVSIPSSFERHGCVPPQMFKWTHYAKAILRAVGVGNYNDVDFKTTQAILQHYGWRSFYIDITKSENIAYWFASNKHSDKKYTQHMCEDIEENSVILFHNEAYYNPSPLVTGHIYVIDKLALESLNLGVYDLDSINAENGQFRFHSQRACLCDCIQGFLPEQVISAHLEIDTEILEHVCQSSGLSSTESLFPFENHDHILRMLLSLPWKRIESDFPIPFYGRTLDLPNYNVSFNKRLNSGTILFSQHSVREEYVNLDENIFSQAVFIDVPETFYYTTPEHIELKHIADLISKNDIVVIEYDSIVVHPEIRDGYEVEKGICIRRHSNNEWEVSGLSLEHPSSIINGVIISTGWRYKIDNGKFQLLQSDENCPCNNDLRHNRHIDVLYLLEYNFNKGSIHVVNDKHFIYKV